MGIEIVEDDVKPCRWKGGDNIIHEVEKLDAATAFLVCCHDLAGGDLERRKQRCRAMPLVVVALPGQGAAVRQLQIALRSFQGLDRWLLVHAQHNGLLRRRDIEADHIGGFGRKVRVVALAPGLASRRDRSSAAQESPDILHVDIAQRRAISGPFQRAKPSGGGLSSTFRIRLSVASP